MPLVFIVSGDFYDNHYGIAINTIPLSLSLALARLLIH